ncbi:HipA family kinase [Peribacillus alkalitolerans]|uniref:HipA family kinase n=1 Tax=Peribacillus alkalitolerans TaxID=1550385 RepID=UPI0013D3CA24|nr:HipA family kinase [Peribacillus alkalitolerans]
MIEPVSYIKTLEGKSNAHLITFDDGRDYVVKYFQPDFDKTLPNEWIGYCLARFLDLPIPYGQLVKIPKEFTSLYPELSGIDQTQYQFASLYVPDCFNGHELSTVPHINNPHSLAAIIVFDYWLCNKDRTRKNILLCDESPNSYKLWIIDQAEILGSHSWIQTDLERLTGKIMKSATHQFMASFIEDEKQFTEQIEIVQKIPQLLLDEIVSMMPEEWNISLEEKNAIVDTLLKRRKRTLPEQIEKFINTVYLPLHNKQT